MRRADDSPVRRFTAALIGKTRFILFLGFGGLFVLMGFGVFQIERLLAQIQARSAATQQRFLEQNRMLMEIRSSLYLSGTLFRDYVLDPDAARSELQLQRLDQLNRSTNTHLEQYEAMMPASEQNTFNQLRKEIESYWKVLNPALSWDSSRRAKEGYQFLRERVYPRRSAVLELADQVALLNEQQLLLGAGEVSALFQGFRRQVRYTLLGAGLIGLVLAFLTARQILQLEREATVRYEQVQHATSELRELSARLVDVQEAERRSISRDLHDEIGQSLSAILVEATNLSAELRKHAETTGLQHVESIQRLTSQTVGVVRNMSLLLRPSMLDDLGLVSALEWQAREMSRRMDMQVDVVGHGVGAKLTDQQRTCVYRVVQEALHNAAKHAGAKSVRVELKERADELRLEIQDDGCGFDPARQKGLGLLGIEERIATLGGAFLIASKPGEGAKLSIRLPLGGGNNNG